MSEEVVVQDSGVEQPVEPVVEPVEPEVIEVPNQPSKYNIEGIGEVSEEDIKEWHQGNLRQSDYTRKTQALAKEREDAKDALELYEYLKANPEIAKRLKQGDEDDDEILDKEIEGKVSRLSPEMQRLEQLERKIAQDELTKELNELKAKYPDFDDIKVLTEAQKRGIDDLEFIYNATRGEKKTMDIDVEKIKADAVAEAKKQIMEELKNNSSATETIIDNGKVQVTQTPKTLTPAQKRVAEGMGVSEEDYLKYI